MTPIFEPLGSPNHWRPSALAAGPFSGLQGGAVASLLTAEVEALAGTRKWGTAVSVTAWFLRPTPMTDLRTQLAVAVVSEGGRSAWSTTRCGRPTRTNPAPLSA